MSKVRLPGKCLGSRASFRFESACLSEQGIASKQNERLTGFKERRVGTYGFAQFQIDVRQADDELKRSIEEFKRLNRAEKNEKTTSVETKLHTESCEKPEEQ